ncbi:MAG: hypothetical protein ACR2JE_04405 [Acidobacteriaceae bacterium]
MNTLICDLNESLQSALHDLFSGKQAELPREVLPYFKNIGLSPVVTLHQKDRKNNGRRKRWSASADCFAPDREYFLIHFEPHKVAPAASASAPEPESSGSSYDDSSAATTGKDPSPGEIASRIDDLCARLGEIEDEGHASGKSFVALKWFRDIALANSRFSWAGKPENRQSALTEAISSGRVITSSISNPKLPSHPTTTIRLNRGPLAGASDVLVQRFRPVPIRHEPLSATISNDRGPR